MSQIAIERQINNRSTDHSVKRLGPVSVQDLVGNTPLLRLNHITGHLPPGVEVYAKAEWFNPSGSVKVRPSSRSPRGPNRGKKRPQVRGYRRGKPKRRRR